MAHKRRKRLPSIQLKRSRRTGTAEGTDSTSMSEVIHIDALPDEVLGSILSLLGTRERVGVEAVSRRWRHISRQYAWRSQTLLEGSMIWNYWTDEERGLARVEKTEIIDLRLKCLLERCFPYLREIRMEEFICGYLDHHFIDRITIAVPNLATLELVNFPLTLHMATLIGQRLSNLKCLRLTSLHGPKVDRALAAILMGCRSLQELDLMESVGLTGETSFAHLPLTLRSINIWGCYGLHASAIDHLGSACTLGQLRELEVSSLPIDCPVMAMGRLFEALPMLEKLVYQEGWAEGEATQQETNAAMVKIGTMKGLKSLNLNPNELVTDEVLEAIVGGCEELEELVLGSDTTNPIHYTPAGIRRLTQPPKLTSFYIEAMPRLNEEVVMALVLATSGRLRKLALPACPLVTDTIIQRVLDRCGALRELGVSNCQGVTNAITKAIGQFVAGIACRPAKTPSTKADDDRHFRFVCWGSSIEAQPGDLEAELKAAHPVLKSVRQGDGLSYGQGIKPAVLDIWW